MLHYNDSAHWVVSLARGACGALIFSGPAEKMAENGKNGTHMDISFFVMVTPKWSISLDRCGNLVYSGHRNRSAKRFLESDRAKAPECDFEC